MKVGGDLGVIVGGKVSQILARILPGFRIAGRHSAFIGLRNHLRDRWQPPRVVMSSGRLFVIYTGPFSPSLSPLCDVNLCDGCWSMDIRPQAAAWLRH